MQIDIFERCENLTGERPLWVGETQTLWWIDVFGRKLHRKLWGTSEREEWSLPANIGSLCLERNGRILIALQNAFFHFDLDRHTFDLVCFPDEAAAGNLRLNDGKTDGAGRFVCGGADYFRAQPIGGVYSLERGICRSIAAPVIIFNGIAWSPDYDILYYADSVRRIIYRSRYDLKTGNAADREIFVTFPEDWGMPDGAAIDSEGYLWVAMVYGKKIVRLDPNGRIEHVIDFPVVAPTSLAFGGDDLSTLFVTTKSRGKNGEGLEVEKGAGSVFMITGLGGVRGIPEPFGRPFK